MIVTDITDMDKKRKKVYLDGEYAFALYNSEIYRYNLEVGEELGEDAYRELDEEIIPKRVKARTLYIPVSYTHLRAHETDSYLVCRLLLEKKKNRN